MARLKEAKPVTERTVREPLWRSVSEDLLRRISEGAFPVDFPGEHALAEHYNVSRGTIRAALRPLRESGHVTSRRGRRPRVLAAGSTTYGPVYSFLATIREAGMNHCSIVLEQGVVSDAEVAGLLGADAGAPLFRLSRVRYADGVAVALDIVWLPARDVSALLEVDFADVALYSELARLCGITLDGGHEQLTAVRADAEQARLLNCDPGSALLFVERFGCVEGRPFEFRRSYILGERMAISTSFGASRP